MDKAMQTNFNNLESEDKNLQYEAFMNILDATKEEVEWAYEVWDELLAGLTSSNNHKRSRYAQFLSNLAISDPEKRMLTDFPAVWEVTKDKRTVTARHSLQAIWRIALAGEEQKDLVINQLVDRFETCESEKNCKLVRFDIIQDLRNLYDEMTEEKIKEIALGLIEKEEDPKYQKKYAKVWKNAPKK
ncbi:hypothetical protein CV093_20495 [Oceanobacillus sp. 143]|jgi:hypothetical protein|uniref:HEAT repeat domain-containing protein n=1 Tax=Oceanobacillus zhaokaii TaxID=2052660 RepID=A0A345PLL1_9BACI|nr:hypothetical protein [Oceanobacillus zhaokaii]AXI10891.1 hypothetical protein CUC15_19020 [Oceanobacillus zhaokaii]QGS69748.1 hypothetical protein CV093_20495 [Oceanobacillus sp. 143]